MKRVGDAALPHLPHASLVQFRAKYQALLAASESDEYFPYNIMIFGPG
jgi:hypothetical protein